MTANRPQMLVLLVLAATLSGSGCVFSRPGSTCRIWADYNTLRAPALFIEETDHLPYPAHRVKHFRWMYNAGTLAQRHVGTIHAAQVISPAPAPRPTPERLVPDPREPAPHDGEPPDSQIPPLPSQPDLLGDQPAPSKPLPPFKRNESDGPTAAKNRSRN